MVLAKFKQDVDIFAIFEKVLEVAHISVLDTSMDFDLTHQLLFGSALRQRRFLDDFGCVDEVGLRVDEFETFCEATFTKELSFEVATDPDFATRLLEFLFDDCLRRRR